MKRLAVLAVVAMLGGCASISPPPPELAEEPPLVLPQPQLQPQPRGQAGGVFTPHGILDLTSDRRAHRPGDVLTVLLQETTQASKRADTQFGKESGVNIAAPVFGGRALRADVGISGERDFKGGASSTQQNALSGSITVIVQEVLPNGLLHIKGHRALTLNQGDELLRLSGYVRTTDVDANNRVSSLRIANARISYAGHGAMADANSAGWLTRFFNSPLFPF